MICVLTHPRPDGVSYLEATLASIDESAKGSRFVITDSEVDKIPENWTLVKFNRPVTTKPENRWSMWRAFKLAHERGEDLIVCEDDILLCKNGAVHAERLRIPSDVHWVSLYDPHHRESTPHALWRAKAETFVFAQMIKFPLSTCELFVRTGCTMYDRMGSDDQLAMLGRVLGLSYGVHVPSLAQHVGIVSAVGNGDLSGRTSESFQKEYDPLTEHHLVFR